MSENILKIPTALKSVQLWVHPEGRVIGSIYLHLDNKGAPEDALSRLNQDEPFLVFKVDTPHELRFYNRQSIVRVEYQTDEPLSAAESLYCQLHMMDGSRINGMIKESLPPDNARLYDYLNKESNRFMKIYVSENEICLINKTYINQVTMPEKN